MSASKGDKGAHRIADIPPEILRQLNLGTRESRTLVEALAVSQATLLNHLVQSLGLPAADSGQVRKIEQSGFAARSPEISKLLRKLLKGHPERRALVARIAGHPSDTVRGWAVFLLAGAPGLDLATRLARARPFAADLHMGVREMAWLAVREAILREPERAIALLTPWTGERDENLRRFASEATRPRGVWCRHVRVLREAPELALPLLEPLRADQSRYVRDSVGNWLNDASKTRPDWVRELCGRWREESPGAETAHIIRRALRTLRKQDQST